MLYMYVCMNTELLIKVKARCNRNDLHSKYNDSLLLNICYFIIIYNIIDTSCINVILVHPFVSINNNYTHLIIQDRISL